jgi:hypothetical protein
MTQHRQLRPMFLVVSTVMLGAGGLTEAEARA